MNKRSLHILVTLLVFQITLYAQQTFSINLDRNSGLPSTVVYDFFQDSKGFIWTATNAGLTRYDGFEFITYTSNDQTSLAGSNIQEDKYGRIWFQNFDGYLYYLKDEQLHSFKQNKPGEYVPFGIVDNYLYVVQQKGVDIYNLKTLRFIQTVRVVTSNVLASTVLNNAYYFLANNTVFRIGKDFKLNKTEYFNLKGIKVNHINNNGQNLFLTYKNQETHALYFLDSDLRFLKRIALDSKGWILSTQYLNNQYWLFTNSGFFAYDQSMKLQLSNENLQLDPFINKCMIDKFGNYWFSSLKTGIHLITDFNNKVYNFNDYDLRNIVPIKNGFLISTQKGVIFETDAQLRFKSKVIDLGEGIQITNFQFDEENQCLFFTTSSGLHIYHKQKQIYLSDIAAKGGLKLDEKYYAVTASGYVLLLKNPMYTQGNKSIWDNLFVKNAANKEEKLAPIITNLRAKSIDFLEGKEQFAVTTNVGLFTVDSSGIKELLVENKPFYASEIFTYNKKIYLLDNIGNLHVVYRSGKLIPLNSEIGIPPNSIKFIKRFGNTLYIVCPNRVFEYDLTYSTSKTFSFNINMLTISDLIKTKNNLILVSGKNIICIDVNKKSLQSNASKFYFNNFYVGTDKVSRSNSIKLDHNQNSIRITYSLLDYGSNIEPPVFYRLNNGEWVKLTAGAREIQLISLSSGKYDLQVKMNNQLLDEVISFEISSPLYMRWWFILTIVLVLILTSVAIYSWRTYLLRAKIKRLNEKIVLENQLRTSMLTSIKAQMNPHFFYNALNTIQSYIFSNDKFHATTYLAKFSKLTRMILEMSGKPTVKLEDELASLQLYLELEQMRFQKDFTFEIEVDDACDTQAIRIPSMLIQPYVENAIKHGLLHKEGDKKVTIQLLDRQDYLEVVIDDNGVGRKRSEEINKQKLDKPKSFSTESNQKRLDLINQDASIVSVRFVDKVDSENNALGTQVAVFISKKITWQSEQ